MATKEINSKASSKTNPSFGGTESLDLGRSTWTKNFYNYAKAAAGSLGDIMSADSLEDEEDATTTTTSSAVTTTPTNNNNSATVPKTLKSQSDRQSSCSTGLVTTPIPSGSLAKQFGIHHPLDRMALTANGNLQRLVSSYYDAPVQVLVDSCDLLLGDTATAAAAATTTTKAKSSNSLRRSSILNRPNMVSKEMKWDRIVHLSVHNQTFCTAHSIITVFDPICQQLVESGQIGIGQLFRYLDILPEFELHNAGLLHSQQHDGGGGFWREYTLHCAELSCDIREDFRAGMWKIRPIPGSALVADGEEDDGNGTAKL